MGLLDLLRRSSKKTPDTSQTITADILDEHLCSIKVRLSEIANYKKKKVVKSPTHVHWKVIDLEEAWPTSRELYDRILHSMEGVATTFHVDPGDLPPYATFSEALKHIDILIERIMYQVENTNETDQYSQEKLAAIDHQILTIQDAANRLQHYVVREFDFTAVLKNNTAMRRAG